MKEEKKLLYRSIGQTVSGLTITADTHRAVTQEEAVSQAKQYVFVDAYKKELIPFVSLPICSEYQWKHGNINFCPRCGRNITDQITDDDPEYAESDQTFECWECNAHIYVEIRTYPEDDEGGESE